MKIACIGGGPAGSLLRHLDEAGGPDARGDGLRAQSRGRHLRLRGGLFRRDAGEPARGRSRRRTPRISRQLRPLGRHRRPLSRARCCAHRATVSAAWDAGSCSRSCKTARWSSAWSSASSTDVATSQWNGDADLVIAADGVNSGSSGALARHFGPDVDCRPNRFVWLGTTFPFRRFTFYFRENEHGLFRVHAYRYAARQLHLHRRVHGRHLAARRPRSGRARTRPSPTSSDSSPRSSPGTGCSRTAASGASFPTVKNRAWHHQNVVLLGRRRPHRTLLHRLGHQARDGGRHRPARTRCTGTPAGGRVSAPTKPNAAPSWTATQRAAQVSLEWFENTERYMQLEPMQFAIQLAHPQPARDPREPARARSRVRPRGGPLGRIRRRPTGLSPAPDRGAPDRRPCSRRFACGISCSTNRVVVSPMCQYSADDGSVDDWHLVHLGSRAVGGAGLVMTEMTDVSREGRISPGCAGLYKPEHVGGVEAHRGLRPPREPAPRSACSSRTRAARARPSGSGRARTRRSTRGPGRSWPRRPSPTCPRARCPRR